MKESAGYNKEEANEHGKSPESQQKAQEGRDLRNEGRIEDSKALKTTRPRYRPSLEVSGDTAERANAGAAIDRSMPSK